MKVRASRVPIEVLRKWLDYNSTSGVLSWKDTKRRASAGQQCGYVADTGHRVLKIERCRLYAHRVAWAMHHGEWPPDDYDVDHVNGNRADNSAANLRLATRSQNIANSRRSRVNTSGAKGVTWNARDKVWQAQIRVNGKRIALGRYQHLETAADAYRAAASKYFGDFANYG